MDLEKAKRMDPAALIRPAAHPALSAQSEFPKNSVNIDKFTGFFDKFLKNNVQVSDCNQKAYQLNLSASH